MFGCEVRALIYDLFDCPANSVASQEQRAQHRSALELAVQVVQDNVAKCAGKSEFW